MNYLRVTRTTVVLTPLFLLGVIASDILVTNNEQCTDIGKKLLDDRATIEQVYISVSLCEGLVHPMDSGIGGGFQALLHHDSYDDLFLMAREYSPRDESFVYKPFVFGNSIGVPSVLAGYAKLLGVDKCISKTKNVTKRTTTYQHDPECVYHILTGTKASGLDGSLSGVTYREIFEPVIKLARNGFNVSRTLRRILDRSDTLPFFFHTKNNGKVTNERLAKLLEFISQNPLRLLDPYTRWRDRRIPEHQNIRRVMLDDIKPYGSHLTNTDFYDYRAYFKKPLTISFKVHNVDYRLVTMPTPAGGEAIAFFVKLLETGRELHVTQRHLTDVQLSCLFLLYSKYSFAAKAYFRQMTASQKRKMIVHEAPIIARKFYYDISARNSESSLVDYLTNEVPGIPTRFGSTVFPAIRVAKSSRKLFTDEKSDKKSSKSSSKIETPFPTTGLNFFCDNKTKPCNVTDDGIDRRTDYDTDDDNRNDENSGDSGGDGGGGSGDSGNNDKNRREQNVRKPDDDYRVPSALDDELLRIRLTVQDMRNLTDREKSLNNRGGGGLFFNDFADETYDYDDSIDSPYGTTNVIVKRNNRSLVATSSINHSFGSLIFSQNLGIPYNNVLRDFTPRTWYQIRSLDESDDGTFFPTHYFDNNNNNNDNNNNNNNNNNNDRASNRTNRDTKRVLRKGVAKKNETADEPSKRKPFANRPKSHSVPQSSMACTLIINQQTGFPVFGIGAAGGFKITSAIMNVMWNYFLLGDTLQKSVSRLRLVTKLNYKTRVTELWYEFPVDSIYYTKLFKEQSLSYQGPNYYELNFLNHTEDESNYERLAYSPKFFYDHQKELFVKYIFEAGYSAVTAFSTMRETKPQAVFDPRRGGKSYIRY